MLIRNRYVRRGREGKQAARVSPHLFTSVSFVSPTNEKKRKITLWLHVDLRREAEDESETCE